MSDGEEAGAPAGIGHNFNTEANELSWMDLMAEAKRVEDSNAKFEARRAYQKRIDEIRGFLPKGYMEKMGLE